MSVINDGVSFTIKDNNYNLVIDETLLDISYNENFKNIIPNLKINKDLPANNDPSYNEHLKDYFKGDGKTCTISYIHTDGKVYTLTKTTDGINYFVNYNYNGTNKPSTQSRYFWPDGHEDQGLGNEYWTWNWDSSGVRPDIVSIQNKRDETYFKIKYNNLSDTDNNNYIINNTLDNLHNTQLDFWDRFEDYSSIDHSTQTRYIDYAYPKQGSFGKISFEFISDVVTGATWSRQNNKCFKARIKWYVPQLQSRHETSSVENVSGVYYLGVGLGSASMFWDNGDYSDFYWSRDYAHVTDVNYPYFPRFIFYITIVDEINLPYLTYDNTAYTTFLYKNQQLLYKNNENIYEELIYNTTVDISYNYKNKYTITFKPKPSIFEASYNYDINTKYYLTTRINTYGLEMIDFTNKSTSPRWVISYNFSGHINYTPINTTLFLYTWYYWYNTGNYWQLSNIDYGYHSGRWTSNGVTGSSY